MKSQTFIEYMRKDGGFAVAAAAVVGIGGAGLVAQGVISAVPFAKVAWRVNRVRKLPG